MENVTTKYSLTPRQRKALADYVAGDITITQAAERMKTDRRNIDRCIAAITKHAVRAGRIDFKELLRHY